MLKLLLLSCSSTAARQVRGVSLPPSAFLVEKKRCACATLSVMVALSIHAVGGPLSQSNRRETDSGTRVPYIGG
jgi:hypothetical protein